ncbi:hypothetical protein E4U24_001113 [Claviceps purpurea]|nr:hypothetical protein E4U37_007775 [Claviceps purpurea]KAG6162272.1 hypothetical protein E4U51_006502 [Claviceps purpurea]KAG6178394.1 hypothetical protein E4U27_003755 [Claviceps purpurea]KAG6190151.1 hypothetical protein E4U10_004740 [Claviceps purpurea]KAG6214161.1 hypothetical protein E4U34_006279 [Claviceps purpurea]
MESTECTAIMCITGSLGIHASDLRPKSEELCGRPFVSVNAEVLEPVGTTSTIQWIPRALRPL